ncbi:MAG: MBL fold metallo-hydrolase [Verrucomicrobia bacterium]|nr:MBL fold metallo-hydrolase [Verrucomicrobiota bacterium]
MKVANLNPQSDIGASSWLLEMDGHRLLMDAGVHPKKEGLEGLPLYDRIEGREMDAIAISHCHHDHVGSLPVAVRRFPRAHVMMPELSYFIVERVLHNSVNVMTKQRDEVGIREYPLYTHNEVDDIASIFQGFRYNREIEWAAFHKSRTGQNSPTLEFFDAGHCLGSAGLLVRGRKETLFYTGDVSFCEQTLLKGARFEGVRADVLIMETTRGSHPTSQRTRAEETGRLAAAIHSVLARKGSVLIPTFALGRTQEILALLALLMREGKLKRQPVYIGGLGRVFTEIYDLQADRTHRNHRHLQLHESLDLVVLSKPELDRIKLGSGRIFVMTAGMMNEHTAAHDLAVRMLGEEKHAIYFVGYADPQSPGGRVKASGHGQTFIMSGSAGEVTRRCQLDSFDLTAHANREELLEFVGEVEPQKVILGHGDDAAREWFKAQIRTQYPKIRILDPAPGETLSL